VVEICLIKYSYYCLNPILYLSIPKGGTQFCIQIFLPDFPDPIESLFIDKKKGKSSKLAPHSYGVFIETRISFPNYLGLYLTYTSDQKLNCSHLPSLLRR